MRAAQRRAAPATLTLRDLALVLLPGLVVRIAFEAQLAGTPFARWLFLDAQHYDAWAARIAAGDWLGGSTPFFFDPGYAYFLAGFRLLDAGHAAVRVAQILLGLGTTVLTLRIAAGIAGRRAGIAAGLLVATYLPLVFFEGLLLKTTLEVFLGTLLLHLVLASIEGAGAPRFLALGVLAGLTCLVKTTFLVVLPVLVAWTWWAGRRAGRARPWIGATSLAAGASLVLACLALRNRVAGGEWVMPTTASGINFYIGNGPEADGARREPDFMRALPEHEEGDGLREAARRAGHALSPAEASRFWWGESLRAIAADPSRWMHLLGVKLRLLLHRLEVTDNISIDFVKRWVPILRWPLPGWWLIAPLGLAGLAALAWTREPARVLLAAFVGAHVAGMLLFHVTDRYRVALVPALVILGVAALSDAWRKRGGVAIGTALAAIVGLVFTNVLPHPVYASGQSLANHQEMLGAAAAEAGDTATALAAFRQAVIEAPARKTPHFNLAAALHGLAHDDVAALAEAREALRIDPAYGDASFLAGEILLDSGRSEEAAAAYADAARAGHRPADAWRSAAAAWGRAGRLDDAQRAIDEALRIAPEDADVLAMLGNIRFSLGDHVGALDAWERALAARPADAELRGNVERLRAALGAPP